MITQQRSSMILRLLKEEGVLSIHRLAELIPHVSEVTIRRDVNRLAVHGLLKRTHGGVVRVDDVSDDRLLGAQAGANAGFADAPEIEALHAVILSPVEGRGALALRNQIKRMPIPFIAESAPQEGGNYLGPNNWAAGYALGCVAARECKGLAAPKLLIVAHESLPNTVMRADGFVAGLRDTLGHQVTSFRVDGKGEFRAAYAAAKDAFQAHPDINMVFGVNDHSVLAAIEASDKCRVETLSAYSVGGEGDAVFEALVKDAKLRACCALFPEIVGRRAIDLVVHALKGTHLPDEVFTPFAILTAKNFDKYYATTTGAFQLRPSAANELDTGPFPEPMPTSVRRPVVSFMPHFPAHDWYRNMARAMQKRADALGLDLIVSAPQAGIAREIMRLRRVIAAEAATRVNPGDTIIIGQGEVNVLLAKALREATALTVVTNSFDVMQVLNGCVGIKVILTAGEYQAKDRCLVGPSLSALFEMMRVDKAFLTADGMSARFGLSSTDERIARASQRFVNAAREIYVLADHTIIGFDANHRIAEVAGVSELITDSGALPTNRLAFAEAGIRVTLADERDDSLSREPEKTRPRSTDSMAGDGDEDALAGAHMLDI